MKEKKLLFFIIVVFIFFFSMDVFAKDTTISYSTHVQSYGWLDSVTTGVSGTTGESKRMEAIKISVDSDISGNIEYLSHVQSYGWESTWKSNNIISGTTGESKRLEAIKIRFTGELANVYDVYYRVHCQSYGWLGWAKNGETAGTVGMSKRLEAIEIKVVPKNTGEATGNSYKSGGDTFFYQSYVQSIGWQDSVGENEISGLTGQSKRIEAIKMRIINSKYSGGVRYQSYNLNDGWQAWKYNGELSGTTGISQQLEAIKIELTDQLMDVYDIYYRVHIRSVGWLDWAKNGEIAGNINLGFRIEAVQIKLVNKGTGSQTGNSYMDKDAKVNYFSHVQSIGNQASVLEGETSGTVGQYKRMEALTINLDSSLSGDILYKTYIEGKGWESEYKTSGVQSGSVGESRAIQLIKIKLTGDVSKKYDVYYRVHSEKYGWLGWAKNDEQAGATCYDIQAIQIRLYLKIDSEQGKLGTSSHYIETGFYLDSDGNTHYKDKNGNEAKDWITINGTKYFFNSLGVMIGMNVKKVIDVSSYQGDIDWDTVKKYGDVDGVILRVAAGSAVEDKKVKRNISELNRLNIPYGVYIYSYAENMVSTVNGLGTDYEGALEAMKVDQVLKKYNAKLTLPIFLDIEGNGNYYGEPYSQTAYDNYSAIVNSFKNKIESLGYSNWKIYTGLFYSKEYLKTDYITSKIAWVAQYYHYCTYKGNYDGWQYSSTESIPGISGGVDVSVWFGNF